MNIWLQDDCLCNVLEGHHLSAGTLELIVHARLSHYAMHALHDLAGGLPPPPIRNPSLILGQLREYSRCSDAHRPCCLGHISVLMSARSSLAQIKAEAMAGAQPETCVCRVTQNPVQAKEALDKLCSSCYPPGHAMRRVLYLVELPVLQKTCHAAQDPGQLFDLLEVVKRMKHVQCIRQVGTPDPGEKTRFPVYQAEQKKIEKTHKVTVRGREVPGYAGAPPLPPAAVVSGDEMLQMHTTEIANIVDRLGELEDIVADGQAASEAQADRLDALEDIVAEGKAACQAGAEGQSDDDSAGGQTDEH